ncbi:MAG: subtilisin family serine protease, partial [Candidatus Promineifilaceae bacterium]
MIKTQQKSSLLFGRLVSFILVAFILSVLLNIIRPSGVQSAVHGKEKIGLGVAETLRDEGEVIVVIALVESTALQSRQMRQSDLTDFRREVATIQNTVLSSLDPTDFRVRHQYQAVPALSGKLFTEDGLIKLAQNPNVRKIDLDVGGSGSLATSVPLIGADTWHVVGVKGEGVVIAVLDSGLDTDHTDLAAGLIHEECFLDNNGSIDGSGLCPNGSDRQSGAGAAEDDAGHGTHVTGIIASQGNQSSVGVASGVKVVSIKVTAGPSFSGVFYTFSEIVAALDFIINNRPDVQIINMSLVTNATFAGHCDN